MKGFQKLVSKLCRFLAVIAGITLVFVMLLTVLDVILRYFGYPITGVYDLVALGGAIVIGFSMPFAAEKRIHVYMEMALQAARSDRQTDPWSSHPPDCLRYQLSRGMEPSPAGHRFPANR